MSSDPFQLERLAFRLGQGVIRLRADAERFWGMADLEEVVPPKTTRQVAEIRFAIGEIGRQLVGGARAACLGELSGALETAWRSYQDAWQGEAHVEAIGEREQTDAEFAWATMSPSLPTRGEAWEELRRSVIESSNSLPQPVAICFRLGLCLAAVEELRDGVEEHDWWGHESLRCPVNALQSLLLEAKRMLPGLESLDVNLSAAGTDEDPWRSGESHVIRVRERAQPLTEKVLAAFAVQRSAGHPPAEPVTPAVTFALGTNENILLKSPHGRLYQVRRQERDLVMLFLAATLRGHAGEVIPWQKLDLAAFGEESLHSSNSGSRGRTGGPSNPASDRLRQLISRLNQHVKRDLRSPRDGKDWLVTVRGQGLRLNESVAWSVSPELSSLLKPSSPFDHPTDPHILSHLVPQPGQAPPAGGRRNPPQVSDDMD